MYIFIYIDGFIYLSHALGQESFIYRSAYLCIYLYISMDLSIYRIRAYLPSRVPVYLLPT